MPKTCGMTNPDGHIKAVPVPILSILQKRICLNPKDRRNSGTKKADMHTPSWLAVLLAISPLATLAAEDDIFGLSLEELGNIEVRVATGTPKSLMKAPAGTSIITAHDLEALAYQDLAEALEAVPGLHVSRGSLFYAPRFFFRGITSSYNPHALVLVNGIPMTSLLVGDRIGMQQWLPAVESVERIEIIRGPGSALYGADAFAGVINVITKAPDEVEGGQASLSQGSFDTTRASLLQGSKAGPVHTTLSLTYKETDGAHPVIRADAQTGVDTLMAPFAIPPASLAPGAVNLGSHSFDARLDMAWNNFVWRTAYNELRDQETGQGLSDALDPQGRWANHLFTTDLTWNNSPADDWELEGQVSYLYASVFATHLNALFPAGADFGTGSFPDGVLALPQYREENARGSLTATYAGWAHHRLRFGTSFYWGDVFQTKELTNLDLSSGTPTPLPGLTDVSDTPAVFQREAQRTYYQAFAQDEWGVAEGWELTTGLRYDHYSDIGSATNPRLALVWSTTPWLTSKLLYGEAFRPPAMSELYATNNPAFLGNPDLSPERLRSTELAFNLAPAPAWALDINLYQFRIRDFIDFVQDPGGSFTAQNVDRIHGRGMETELRWHIAAPLQLLANYSYQHTAEESSEEPLGLAPRDKVFMRAIWTPRPFWQITPQLTWVGERLRQAGDTRAALKGQTSFDLTVRRVELQQRLALALIGRNLFDADMREPSRGPGPGQAEATIPDDLPQAGRSIVVEARIRW